MAGHDINFLAVSGVLSVNVILYEMFEFYPLYLFRFSSLKLFGRKNENPMFPLNILGIPTDL